MKWDRLSITIRLVAALMAFLMLSTGFLGASYILEVGISAENWLFAFAMIAALLLGGVMAFAAIGGRSPDLRDHLIGMVDDGK